MADVRMSQRQEWLEASDQEIEDAAGFTDLMARRELVDVLARLGAGD
jgi:hypothetical protein